MDTREGPGPARPLDPGTRASIRSGRQRGDPCPSGPAVGCLLEGQLQDDRATPEYQGVAAAEYARQISYDRGPDAAKKAFFRACVPDLRGQTVLDLGGGDGNLGRQFLIPERGAKLVINLDLFGIGEEKAAVDIASHKFVQIARSDPPEGLQLVAADMHALPIGAGKLDAVVSCYALHYAKNIKAVRSIIADVARTLRPGGSFVLLSNMISGKDGAPLPKGFPAGTTANIRLSESVLLHNRMYPEVVFLDALREAGFRITVHERFSANDTVESYADPNVNALRKDLHVNGVVISAVLEA